MYGIMRSFFSNGRVEVEWKMEWNGMKWKWKMGARTTRETKWHMTWSDTATATKTFQNDNQIKWGGLFHTITNDTIHYTTNKTNLWKCFMCLVRCMEVPNTGMGTENGTRRKRKSYTCEGYRYDGMWKRQWKNEWNGVEWNREEHCV